MGAEEYELLVSALDEIPTLESKITLNKEKIVNLHEMRQSVQSKVYSISRKIETRDSELKKINSELSIIEERIPKNSEELYKEKDRIVPIKKELTQKKTALEKRTKKIEDHKEGIGVGLGFILFPLGFILGTFIVVYIDELSNGDPGSLTMCFGLSACFLSTVILPAAIIWYVGLLASDAAESKRTALVKKMDKEFNQFEILQVIDRKLRNEEKALLGKQKTLIDYDRKLNENKREIVEINNQITFLIEQVDRDELRIKSLISSISPLIPYSDLLPVYE